MKAFGETFSTKKIREINPVQIATLILLLPLLIHSSTLVNWIPLYTYDATRFLTLFCFLATSIYLAWHQPRINVSHFQFWGFLAVSGIILISLAINYQQSNRVEALLTISLIALAIQYHAALRHYGRNHIVELLAWVLIASGALYTAVNLGIISSHCIAERDCLYLGTSGFENRRMYNDLQALIIPAAIWMMLQARNTKLTLLLMLLASLQLTHLFITDGRAAMLGILAGGLVVWWANKWKSQDYIKVGLTLLISLGLYLLLKTLDANTDLEDINIRTSSSGRIELWIAAIQGGLTAPLWGQGPGSFAFLEFPVAGPHNLFFSLLHDYGFLVFGLSLAVFWLLMKNLLASKKPLLTLLFFGVSATWLFTTATPAITTTMTLLIICLALSQKEFRANGHTSSTIIVVFMLAALTSISLHDFNANYQGSDLRPRIWVIQK